jgi:predicted ATPase
MAGSIIARLEASMAHAVPRHTNLVPPLGRFVGRAAAIDAIDRHFAAGVRLLTLVGPPGMGKTRLAMRYADLRGAPFLPVGGVWFCDLTEARDVNDLCAVVARAVGLRLGTQVDVETMVDDVAEALARAGALLIVFDNFEQLGRGPARTVEQWCAMAPEARMIVTSRERLGVTGEAVIELVPLELPSAGESKPAQLLASEAVALFEERARAAGGWDETRPGIAREVAALVRQLDGIPLAIELAAARSRVLAPAELLARLAHRSGGAGILLGGARELSSRHATLRAAIDWSWSMLSGAERSALVQCSIFAGDFSLDAAERVIDLADEPGAPPVVDVVAALRDKSLVRSIAGTASRGTRFSLYVSIREYATERAASSPGSHALAERHRRYYIDTTRELAEAYARDGDVRSRALLAAEKDNLLVIQRGLRAKAALSALGALSRAEASDLGRVILHLEPTVEAETSFDELVAMYTAGIEAAALAGDEVVRGRLLIARGNAFGIRGETAACLADLEAARDLGRARADHILEAEARLMAGVRYRQQGRFDDAWSAGEQAAALLDGRGHPRPEGANFAIMGLLLCELGRTVESRRYNLRARAIFHAAGDRWSEGLAIANLAQLDQAAGDFEQAAHGYDRALERFRADGDRRYEGRYLAYRACLEHERGALDAARASYATALEMLAYFRMRHHEGLFRACLGALEASEGHAREAMTELDAAEDLLGTIEAPAFVVAIGVHRGHLDLLLAREAAAKGDQVRAERLTAAAAARIRELPLAASSEDVRFAIRLLERSLAPRGPGLAPLTPMRAGLVIGPAARWFALGEGARVDLGRRGAIRLILLGLVERRLAIPGATLAAEALLGLGWPGERVQADAGGTRVRVAVSTLRRLGLAGLLLTREDGYLLDPRVPVSMAPEL